METTDSASVMRRVPSGPSSWPLLGNLLDMRAAGDMAAYFDRLWRAHGDSFRFKLLGTNALVVTHPEALKQVLSTRRDRYVKDKIYDTARGMLLSMLLAAVDAQTGKPLANRDVRDEVLTLFFAGHETTALTLAWMFTFLGGRREILDRMRDEVDEVLGGREPTFEDVPKLAYVRQVVEETLRLRPPAPIIPRNAVEEDEIDGFRVTPGDVVFMFFWGTHRHPAFWHEAETFEPERFSPERSNDRHSWSFVPFSGGPRTCIGNMFALVEASILVAQMLTRFDFEVGSCADVKPVAVATMPPSLPIRVLLRRRAGARA